MSAIPHQLRAGNGTTTREALGGQAISLAANRAGWKHPWQITPAWQAGAGHWAAVVKPGFVNEQAPVVRTRQDEQKQDGRNFGLNPLTGRKFFSDPIFNHGPTVQPAQQVIDIPLYLSPAINLSFRAVGFDGGTSDVPQFFLDRGAAQAPSVNLESPSGDTARPAGLRLLRACDVWLHMPRLALTSDVTLAPGPATGISNVTQTLSVRSAAPGDVLQVQAGTWVPPNASFDPLTFQYDEPNFDELLIGTVFLLSPPGLAEGSTPDGTWTWYVRHELFWNLNYQPGELVPLNSDPAIPFIPPLAAGAAQLVINFLGASLNDATTQALNILTAHSLAGTWWTPTGGGSSAAFPPDAQIASLPATGLDKNARLAAQRAAAAAARRAQQLDPDFPYRAISFPSSLLSAA